MPLLKQTPLYRFLKLCDEGRADKSVLDCGAGGDMPFLSEFFARGYLTTGVEIDARRMAIANEFGEARGQSLKVQLGDMRRLGFADSSFGCVYSYNTIFHMPKADVEIALCELKRVLKPGGYLFVNFLSVDDHRCGEGPCLGLNQYEQLDDGQPVIHSYYEHREADPYFADMTLHVKETRVIEWLHEGRPIRQGFVDYIVQKK